MSGQGICTLTVQPTPSRTSIQVSSTSDRPSRANASTVHHASWPGERHLGLVDQVRVEVALEVRAHPGDVLLARTGSSPRAAATLMSVADGSSSSPTATIRSTPATSR